MAEAPNLKQPDDPEYANALAQLRRQAEISIEVEEARAYLKQMFPDSSNLFAEERIAAIVSAEQHANPWACVVVAGYGLIRRPNTGFRNRFVNYNPLARMVVVVPGPEGLSS